MARKVYGFVEIGHDYLDWGYNHDPAEKSEEVVIREMPDSKMTNCLLLALLREVMDLRKDCRKPVPKAKPPIKSPIEHPVSEGMHHWLGATILMEKLMAAGIDDRVDHLLSRLADLEMPLTWKNLRKEARDLRNVGVGTIARIELWCEKNGETMPVA